MLKRTVLTITGVHYRVSGDQARSLEVFGFRVITILDTN